MVARRAHNPKVAGSSPVPATTKIHSEMIVHCAGVAQSAERILGKDKVTGSIPVNSSILGGLAQLARACGSYPQCPEFESPSRHHTQITSLIRGYFYMTEKISEIFPSM